MQTKARRQDTPGLFLKMKSCQSQASEGKRSKEAQRAAGSPLGAIIPHSLELRHIRPQPWVCGC